MSFRFITYIFTILFIAFTPLDAIEVSEGSGTTLGRYLFLAMLVCSILSGTLIPKESNRILKILITFVIWAFFSSLWSINLEESLIRDLFLLQYLIIFCVMVNNINSQMRLKIAMGAWIVGAVYIAYLTANDFARNAAYAEFGYRVDEFGNPNKNSFMLCYGLIFCYLIDKAKFRIPSLILTAYSVWAIVANGSRMGIILFTIIVISFCIQLWQSRMKLFAIALIPLIIIGGIFVLNHIPEWTLMRILGISENIEEGDFATRQIIWSEAMTMLIENPLWSIFGCGWGTFREAIFPYFGLPIGAHNFYLDVLCTTGIIGLAIIILYFYKLLLTIKNTNEASLMNYLMLIIPMISMMSTNWQSRRWWFMMGAFIFLIQKYHNFIPSQGNEYDKGIVCDSIDYRRWC